MLRVFRRRRPPLPQCVSVICRAWTTAATAHPIPPSVVSSASASDGWRRQQPPPPRRRPQPLRSFGGVSRRSKDPFPPPRMPSEEEVKGDSFDDGVGFGAAASPAGDALFDDFDGDDGDDGGRSRDDGDEFIGQGDADRDGDDEDAALKSRDRSDRAEAKRIRDDIDGRTGRLYTDPWEIADEDWMSGRTYDDLEDWTPALATRKSLETVKVHPDGVPTLRQIADLVLPPSPPLHPGHGDPSPYAAHRKRQIRTCIRAAVKRVASSDVERIVSLESWGEKQDAVDALYESVPDRVRDAEAVLAKQPDFEEWVEKGLEEVLRMARAKMATEAKVKKEAAEEDVGDEKVEHSRIESEMEEEDDKDEAIVPVFMDLLAVQKPSSDGGDAGADGEPSFFFGETDERGVPNLVRPLKSHGPEVVDRVGRMVEEWDLAAHKGTRRILMRESTREVAEAVVGAIEGMEDGGGSAGAARVAIHGPAGAGKTALLASIVASARVSGCVVAYHPDGDRLRKHGYYVDPSVRRKGLYDLPEISREMCEELWECHGKDVSRFRVDADALGEFFTKDQVKKVLAKAAAERNDGEDEDGSGPEGGESPSADGVADVTVEELLRIGSESSSLAPGCHSAAIAMLMNQTDVPFVVAMDEFNCYYDRIGHYFHMDYDADVRKAIPLDRITAFKPILDAMGLSVDGGGVEGNERRSPVLMKRGAVVVATSESRAVARKTTAALVESARDASEEEGEERPSPVRVVEVRRFTTLEVQHVLHNFDVIGLGRLRFEGGNTVLNPEEVAYLRMVSGGRGQLLVDACII